ncbi:hypothetical protein [uncultured Clostridium sp.]|jgi:hypothetical protein|uniref:hypothetical protein n=1 Tax=uncultured Clostridium sp. TaxID=59620 RepID=UPI002612CD91|nr:hypothetical protein [uncultured Clostridium sp.]
MDKILVSKLIGKNNAIILEDQIYNLRDILDSFRGSIITQVKLKQSEIFIAKNRLSEINTIVEPMIIVLLELVGYTNSKKYLDKYLRELSMSILELIKAIGSKEEKDFIYYTNILMDLVLKY